MVEGLVVATFLVLVFFCLVWMAGLYRAKLLAQQDARYRAVHNAVNDCEIAGRAYASTRPATIMDEAPVLPGQIPPSFGINLVRTLTEGGGVARATSTGEFVVARPPPPAPGRPSEPLPFEPRGQRVSSHAYMFCNEKKRGINLASVVMDAVVNVGNTILESGLPLLGDLAGM